MRIALIQQVASGPKPDNVRRGLAALERAAADGAQVVSFAELAFEPFYPQRPIDEVALAARGRSRDAQVASAAGSDARSRDAGNAGTLSRSGNAADGPTPPQDGRADFHHGLLDLAETIPGPTTEAFAAKARELGVVVVLNLYERAGDRAYDSSPVIDAEGSLLGITRMIHITEYACFHEQGYYSPGDRGAPVYETRHGRIGVAICYDRHYPEYMRSLALDGAQVVFVPQAGAVGEWPDGLYEAEMQVAAFQNGYFTALCNRVGPEEYLEFAGESFVCDPAGRVTARAGSGTEEILLADLDLDLVEKSHARELFLRDRRPELYAKWIARN